MYTYKNQCTQHICTLKMRNKSRRNEEMLSNLNCYLDDEESIERVKKTINLFTFSWKVKEKTGEERKFVTKKHVFSFSLIITSCVLSLLLILYPVYRRHIWWSYIMYISFQGIICIQIMSPTQTHRVLHRRLEKMSFVAEYSVSVILLKYLNSIS